jgi:hypothetical protein
VQLSPDGDGTVPLLSLGALCAGGWRTRRLNPAGVGVVIREYPNNPVAVFKDARYGPAGKGRTGYRFDPLNPRSGQQQPQRAGWLYVLAAIHCNFRHDTESVPAQGQSYGWPH